MRILSKNGVNLPDGDYKAIWSGYKLVIIKPDESQIKVETIIGVRGINISTKVMVENESIYLVK